MRKVYLAGAIQYDWNADDWRQRLIEVLPQHGFEVLNPCSDLQTQSIQQLGINQIGELQDHMRELLLQGKNEEFHGLISQIRQNDLEMVVCSDAIIAYIDFSIPTFGTTEQILLAVQNSVPVILVTPQQPSDCSYWLLSILFDSEMNRLCHSLQDVYGLLEEIFNDE